MLEIGKEMCGYIVLWTLRCTWRGIQSSKTLNRKDDLGVFCTFRLSMAVRYPYHVFQVCIMCRNLQQFHIIALEKFMTRTSFTIFFFQKFPCIKLNDPGADMHAPHLCIQYKIDCASVDFYSIILNIVESRWVGRMKSR